MSLKLNMINSMLKTTGTAALSAADTSHPSYVSAADTLDEVIEEFCSKPLWFNTSIRTLAADVDGRVVVPSNALSCDPTDGSLSYAIRGQYLFDLDNYTNIISCSVECYIRTELALEDMPPIALQFIRAQARLMYFVDQDGSGTKVKLYTQAFAIKERELERINMNHRDTNFFGGASYAWNRTRRAGTNPITQIQ